MSTAPDAAATPRFAAQRDRILDAGGALINERGLKGLSLGAVAERIGLGGTSVTYYFRRKELLAAACYDRALDRLAEQVDAALAKDGTAARIESLLTAVAADARREAAGDGPRLARMHEMRAAADPQRAALLARYFGIFRSVRALLPPARGNEDRLLQVMRAQVVLEVAHTLPTWLVRHAAPEHPRIVARLLDVLMHGLVAPGAAPPVVAPLPPAPAGDAGRDRFLDAATILINERGYRGASVERIAACLKVTKGSFYHHLDAKDDLVLACLRRNLDVIGHAQEAAIVAGGRHCDRLASAVAALLGVQLGDGTPLLRSTALPALPLELWREAGERFERRRRRFSGLIADGIAEGSLRPVDAVVAGQVLMSALDAALDLRDLGRSVPIDRAVDLYASIVFDGIVAA